MSDNIIERLQGGCVQCGESDDGAIELFDIEGANDLMEDAAEAISGLLSIAKRWIALDGGGWDTERYVRTKAALLEDTRKLVVELSCSAGRLALQSEERDTNG